ncbi:MAG TPA: hypothetical protein VF212_13625 [Longimicrobiales bacterium]
MPVHRTSPHAMDAHRGAMDDSRENDAAESVAGFYRIEDACVMDTSENRPVYMLLTPSGAYVRLSPSAYELLRLLNTGISSTRLAAELSKQSGREITAETIEAAAHRISDEIRRIDSNFRPAVLGFWIRKKILPARVVERIAGYLTFAYHRPFVLCLLSWVGLAAWLMSRQHHAIDMASGSFWVGYILFVGSIVAHEFGHSTACVAFGAKPGDIGAALYLIYPVLYSNVTDAWRLKRWQRVVVDLGGLYFQAVTGAAYVTAYAFTAWEPLIVAAFFIVTGSVFSLNPIFKFDGYWIVSDALGVTNLSRQVRHVIDHFKSKLRGQRGRELPWSAGILSVLTVYSVLSIGVWTLFLAAIIPWLVPRLFQAYVDVLLFLRDLLVAPGSLTLHRFGLALASALSGFIAFRILWRTARYRVWPALIWSKGKVWGMLEHFR